jgi:predicted Zn-dependent protease
VALEELGGRVRGLAEQGNAIAETHNRTAGTFNDLYGSARQFHKGEYNGHEITVFEFHDARDFTLLLAHELGHVLGIGHVDDPAAIMHAVGGKQVVDPLALTAADTAALKEVCGRPFF